MLRPNDEYIRRLIETVNSSPFPRHLPMKLASIEVDHAVVACETAACHLQPFGIVHGGVVATLIDTATFWSVFMRLPQDAGLVNIDLKLNYLRPVSNGTITARGIASVPGAPSVMPKRESRMMPDGFWHTAPRRSWPCRARVFIWGSKNSSKIYREVPMNDGDKKGLDACSVAFE